MKFLNLASRALRVLGRVQSLRLTALRSKFVLFDDVYLEEIQSLLGDQRALTVFDPRFRDIYLFELLSGIVRWAFSDKTIGLTHYYFLAFLQASRPQAVVTAVDNNAFFYSARKTLAEKDIRFIVFQNGTRWTEDVVEAGTMKRIDTFFTITSAYQSAWEERAFPATLHAIGTLGSKFAFEYKGIRPSDALTPCRAGFVSSWAQNLTFSNWEVKKLEGPTVSAQTFFSPEIRHLPTVRDCLLELGYALEIIGASAESPNSERDFYTQILGHHGWRFLPRKALARNYRLLSRFGIVIGADSTLAYEALATNCRVLFLDTKIGAPFRLPFGYPDHVASHSSKIHLTDGQSENWKGMISSVLKMEEGEYRAIVKEVLGESVVAKTFEDVKNLFDNSL